MVQAISSWLEEGWRRQVHHLPQNYVSHGALRRAQESVENRLRLRIQTWQRHHGLLEPLQESDSRGENVRVGVAGELKEPFCVSCKSAAAFCDISVSNGGCLCPFRDSGGKKKSKSLFTASLSLVLAGGKVDSP